MTADSAADAASPVPARSGSIVWRRRRAAFARTWAAMWSDPQGRAGIIVLGVAILTALLAPVLVSADALDITKATAKGFAGPSWSHPLGTDDQGRSLLALLIKGSQVTMLVGFCSAAISMVIGTFLGVVSGHFGRWVDTLIMRFDDWMLVLPFLPLVIVLTALPIPFLGNGPGKVIVVLGITSWPGMTRVLRAQVLSIKQRPYMERARALGASNTHQMLKHTLPNLMPLILANATLTVAAAILSESSLQFLGIGDPFSISWGTLLNSALDSHAVALGDWWYLLTPGVAIVLVVLGFTWCGNALEKILNPRLAGR
jgi:peptide/nickel transport system permease protein